MVYGLHSNVMYVSDFPGCCQVFYENSHHTLCAVYRRVCDHVNYRAAAPATVIIVCMLEFCMRAAAVKSRGKTAGVPWEQEE